MNQLEIQFFWPLTEQIPLGLDYANCEKPKLYTGMLVAGSMNIGAGSMNIGIGATSTTTYALHVDGKISMNADEMTFKTSKKPNIIRRALFNVMGIKLEKK